MSWLDMPMVAIDTETTSADPTTARLVQVTVGWSNAPGQWAPWTRVVNPGAPIPVEAIKVHGYSDERVREVGLDPRHVLQGVRDTLRSAALLGVPVVAHNAAYDLTVLDREFRRHLDLGVPPNLLVLDTLVLFRRFDWRTGGHSLTRIAARHGITFPAHDAEADALACLRLLHILGGQNDLLGAIPLDWLHEAQGRWWPQQQDVAEARALGNGTQFTRQPHWPLIPMEADHV